MDMTGERHIPAPRDRVWNALLDPDVLRRAIPGCKSLERAAENVFRGAAAVQVGPIAANFAGDVTVQDLDPPASYRIEGSAQGGPDGFTRGGATVTLAEQGAFTLLSYTLNAEVGGKLAQLGSRVIDASARQLADQFFERFTAEVAGPVASAADGIAGLADSLAHPAAVQATGHGSAPATVSLLAALPREPMGFPLVAWVGGAAWLVIFLMLFSAYL
jgi:carbon monoxide dehydrogenase subunit G